MIEQMRAEGARILANQKTETQFAADRATPIQLVGYDVLATNSTVLASEVGHILAKRCGVGLRLPEAGRGALAVLTAVGERAVQMSRR